MAGGGLIKGAGNHFATHRTLHFGHFLWALIDQQDDQIALRMIGGNTLRDVLQHHGLACLGRRDDESALALADGRDQINDPGGNILGAAITTFQSQAFIGVQRRQIFEQYFVLGGFWRFEVDFADFEQSKVAFTFLGWADLTADRIASTQVEAADLARGDVDIVGASKVRAVGRAQKAKAIL